MTPMEEDYLERFTPQWVDRHLPGFKREFANIESEDTATIEPPTEVEMLAKIHSYSGDETGFQRFCDELGKSHDPRVMHMLLWLGDHVSVAAQHFKNEPDELYDIPPMAKETMVSRVVVTQFLQNNPQLLIPFATAYYQYAQANPAAALTKQTRWGKGYERNRIQRTIESRYFDYGDYPEEPLTRGQFEALVIAVVEYLAGGGRFTDAGRISRLINRYDAPYAARQLTEQLHDVTTLTSGAEHNIIALLAELETQPAKIADDRCKYLGMELQLAAVPSSAERVGQLSLYGNVGILNAAGEIVGQFSLHDLTRTEEDAFHVLVRELGLRDLFFQTTAEGGIPPAEQAELAQVFKTAYRTYAEHPLFNTSPLVAFPLKEQVGLIRLLRSGDNATIAAIQNSDHLQEDHFLRACALIYVYNGDIRTLLEERAGRLHIKSILKSETSRDQTTPIDQFVRFVHQAEISAGILYTELRRTYPDLELNVEDVTRGLVTAAADQLSRIASHDEAVDYQHYLETQANNITLGLTFFREVIGLVQRDGVDLHDYARRQQALTRLVEHNPELHRVFVDTLIQCKKLKPDPELFWRVDREQREYNERTGIRVIDLAKTLANTSTEKEIFFEPGAGAGRGLAERTEALTEKYYNFAINDNVYYSLRKLLATCFDFEALELPDQERDAFVDYIFKVIYLAEGAVGDYDQATITSLTADPNNLKQFLVELSSKLQHAEAVPSEYGIVPQPDGTKVYPNKIRWREQSKAFQAAIGKLQTNPASSLRPDLEQTDLKQAIPIFPIGMTVGDFSEINKLADNQIKCGVDVRALIYAEGEAYINCLVALGHKLKAPAVYVSDSPRENFGKVYRLPELREIEKQLGSEYTIYVVTGPGVPGDDFNQTAAVRSTIITKGDVPLSLLQDHLTSSAYVIRRLDEVLQDEPYLRSLDPTGSNYDRLQAAV